MSESHHLCRPRTSCHHISRLRPAWVPDLFRACPKATAISTDLVIPATPAPPHPTYPLRIWSGRDPSRLSPDDLPRDARGIIMSLVMRSDPSDVTFPVTRFLEARDALRTEVPSFP